VEAAGDAALDEAEEALGGLCVRLAVLADVLAERMRHGAVLGEVLANGEVGQAVVGVEL
jgi:hypothetical protein